MNAPPVLSAEDREVVLEQLRSGRNNSEAAGAVGLTGTKLRAMILRDPDLRALVDEVKAEGRLAFRDELLSELRRRLLGRDGAGGEGSDRLLAMALTTYDDEWREVHRKVREAAEASADGLPVIHLNLDLLTDGQAAELRGLLERLDVLVAIGQGRAANPERAQLEETSAA